MDYWTMQRFAEYIQGGAASSLKARDYKDATDLVQEEKPTGRKYILRRLTPLECCRLQGFPDWWCDGVEGSDTAKYKMWGNGIALPNAVFVLGRLARELRKSNETQTTAEVHPMAGDHTGSSGCASGHIQSGAVPEDGRTDPVEIE